MPHVHAHIIPRHLHDLTNPDDIYALIESDAGHLGKVFRDRDTAEVVAAEVNKELKTDGQKVGSTLPIAERPKFPVPVPDELRRPRTVEEMEVEARLLARVMGEIEVD